MIRINLLPHREMRRERRKKEFIGMAVVAAASAVVAALAVGAVINEMSAQQAARNEFLTAENAKLDEQIKEIANLRAEIESLKARQQAVENLQSDRTLPVHLMDELVRVAPDGMHFRAVRQDELKVTITGYAQSNERVSELLRNLAYNAPWLERPELGEIKLVSVGGSGPGAKDARRAYEFSLNALLKRPARAEDKDKADKMPKVAGADRATIASAPASVAAAPGK